MDVLRRREASSSPITPLPFKHTPALDYSGAKHRRDPAMNTRFIKQFIKRLAKYPFGCLWIVNLLICEFILPKVYIENCSWPRFNERSSDEVHIALFGDPQLTDRYSYKQSPGILLWLTQFYSDIYMKRNYRILNRALNPDFVIILGDIMDGGRHWEDPEFNIELKRVRSVFMNPDPSKFIYIPGNHDIGFGETMIPHAYDRYKTVFGEPNYSMKIANHTFVAIEAMSMAAGIDKGFGYNTEKFIQSFIASENNTDPKILLTHVPLYRPDDTYCGPLRNRPLIKQARGFQYQNLIQEHITESILSRIKPSLIFSGDDHDDCVYRHQSKQYDVVEHTIATFSWLQGNHFPGFAVLTLRPPSSATQPTFLVSKCSLPPQIRIYIWYIFLLLLTLAGCVILARIKRDEYGRVSSEPLIPLYELPSSSARNINDLSGSAIEFGIGSYSVSMGTVWGQFLGTVACAALVYFPIMFYFYIL